MGVVLGVCLLRSAPRGLRGGGGEGVGGLLVVIVAGVVMRHLCVFVRS